MSSSSVEANEFLIVHATDLQPDGQKTFDHAVALARQGRGRLLSLHVTDKTVDDEGAEARKMLDRLAQFDESVAHEVRVEEHEKDPLKALVKIVRELEPQLLVVGTRRQSEKSKLPRSSVSEKAALDTDVPTLVVHIGQEGIIDGNGEIRLQRVLLPVGDGAEARDTITGLTKFLDQMQVDDIDIFLLRVGDDDVLDHLKIPERDGWRWHREVKKRGFVANTVAEVCETKDIDMIAMATRGKDGFVDVFSGTHTEKVIRRAPRPVLALKAEDVVDV